MKRNKKRAAHLARLKRRCSLIEKLEERQLLVSDWHNPIEPVDVDNDMVVSPIDALIVINRLNRNEPRVLSGSKAPLEPFIDTDGDGLVSPIDALRVINALNRDPTVNRAIPRIEGEAAPAPVGFLSIPIMQMPGSPGQVVPLSTTLSIGREEFNELGIFVADDASGRVDGLAPGEPGYAEAAFNSSQRRVLYSRFSAFRTASESNLPAGSYAHVYVLQGTSDSSDPSEHLRTRQVSTNVMRVGWEEHVSPFIGWTPVGDRGFDDATVDFLIGEPFDGNAEPVLRAIPNQTIDELTLLVVDAFAMDSDMPDDVITYSLDIAPIGVSIDSVAGRITWIPTEAQGPGNFEFLVRATDAAGAFDTESFFVTVLEVNQSPVLAPIANITADPGASLTIQASATDADLPVQVLTYSLLPGAPSGATINAATGEFRWDVPANHPSGSFPVTVQVMDDGSPRLSDTESFNITVGCAFGSNLDGWTAIESGGSLTGRGTVMPSGCAITLMEGDSFLVGMERTFMIPETPTAIQFTYDDLTFDTTDPNFIKDAFEVALVDRDGNALVAPFAAGRDAFFNVTEGMQAASGQGIQVDGNTITVGLNGIPVGTEAKIIFRLANNDADATTSLTLSNFAFIQNETPVLPFGLAPSKFPSAQLPYNLGDSSDRNFAAYGFDQSRPIEVTSPDRVADDTFTTNDLNSSFEPQVKWWKREFQEYPLSIGSGTTPVVIDLDSNGIPEIIVITHSFSSGVGTPNGVLRVLSGIDGSEVWSHGPDKFAFFGYSQIAAGDITGDGKIEIVVAEGTFHGNTNRLLAFSADGTLLWRSVTIDGGIGVGGASIADLDGDGYAEIIVAATVIEGRTGQVRWSGRQQGGVGLGGTGFGNLSIVADLNLDGIPEVIAGNTAYYSDGAVYWNAIAPDGFTAIGNFDDDPQPEVVLVSSGNLYILEHDGSIKLGPVPIPGGGRGGPPTVADFSGDGRAEIGVAGAFRYVVFKADGTILWQTPIQDGSSNFTGSSVFDFDGDGQAEVVYNDELYLRILRGADGEILYQRPNSSCTGYEYPVVVDADGNGRTNIVVVSNQDCGFGPENGVLVLESDNWVSTRKVWNQHSYHITNINDDGSIPRQEANSWQVYNNYRRNLQPTGTQFGPPRLTVSSPTNRIEAGSTVLLSGLATADGFIAANQRNTITNVTANGLPVVSLDALGRFFEPVTIQPGINDFIFATTDAAGQQVSVSLQILGTQRDPNDLDFSRYSDITGSFSGRYFRTSFNEQGKLLHVDLATRNDGQFVSDVPLLVGVKNVSDPSVRLVGFDGFMPDGTPYYDYSEFVAGGRLQPGQLTESPTVLFHNPNRVQFDYELVFLGKLNEAPYFTSVPRIESLAGRTYTYDADAIDPDADPLAYSLLVAPAGMTINENTGIISWTTSNANIGQHDITVHTTDGRGGSAEQRYTLSVIAAPPNRPPVITSTPVTSHFATSAVRGDGFPDFVIDYFAGGSAGLTEPFGRNPNGRSPEPVSPDVVLGAPPPGPRVGWNPATRWLSIPQGSYVTLGFRDEIIVDGPGDDIFIRSLDPADSARESSDIYVSTNGVDFVYLGAAAQGGNVGLDLAQINLREPVQAIRVVGLDNRGSSPGFDLVSIEVFPNSIGDRTDYQYDVVAIDPDFDTLTYSLPSGKFPAGMSINSATGAIRWSPTADQVGDHTVVVRVDDGRGGIAEQEFIVCVHPDPANHAPVIVSQPTNSAIAGAEYQYAAQAVDADSDPLTFSLITSPMGMLVNRDTGLLSWDIPNGTSGLREVTIRVEDGRGGFDEQSFTIDVVAQGTGQIRGSIFADVAETVASSTFDLNLDGWTSGAPPQLSWRNEDGNPDGYLHFQVTTGVHPWVEAPTKFLGDWSTLDIVGELQFDLTILSDGGQVGRKNFVTYEVIVDGAGGRANWQGELPTSLHPWETLKVPIEESAWTVTSGTWAGILDNVSRLRIRTELVANYDGGLDSSGLDNVRLARTKRAPENWTVYLDQNQNAIRDSGERYTLTDANGNYVFTELPEGTYYVREELQPGWQQALPGNGSYVVPLDQSQIASGYNFGNFQVTASANRSPQWISHPTTQVTANDLYRYAATAQDLDHDPLTYGVLLAPAGMTVHPTLGVVVWVPRPEQVGDHQVILRVTDGRGGTAIQTFVITVDSPNHPPMISSLPATMATAGQAYSYRLRTQDADGDPVSYRFEDAPAGMTFETVELRNSANELIDVYEELAWTPEPGHVGTSPNVTLVVEDGRGGEDRQSWAITVQDSSAANIPPVFTSVPRTTARLGLTWSYLPQASDADGDAVTFSLDQAPDGMQFAPSGIITWTPPADAPAIANVTIMAVDSRGQRAFQTFALQVVSLETNGAPTIISTPRSRAISDQRYAYDPVAFDPDGDPLFWSLTTAPRGMSIDARTGAIRWTPDDQQLGKHVVAVTVTDPLLGQSTQRFDLHVGCNNLAPAIVSVPPTTALTSRIYLYAVRGEDAERDPLSWSLEEAPSGMTIDSAGVIRWTPSSAQVGSHDVVIAVSDGLSVGRQRYSIVAKSIEDEPAANRPPLITSTPVFNAEVDAVYQYQVTALDPDGDAITYSLNSPPAGMTISSSGLITWTPTVAQVGQPLISVVATDAKGAIATQGFVLSVKQNLPPQITSTPIDTATAGATYRYSVRAIDPDGDPLTYRLNNGPDGMTIDPFGRILWTSDTSAIDPQTVTVVVSDDRGQIDTQSFTITMLADTQAPNVSLTIQSGSQTFAADARVDFGSVYTVRVLATDNVKVSDFGLRINGRRVTLDSSGAITLSADTLGTVQLEAIATDLAGNLGTATGTVAVVRPGSGNTVVPSDPTLPPHPGFDPTDNRPPFVEIISPQPATTVTNVVPIIGTVTDPEDNLWYYRVYYARADRVSLTQIDVDDPNWVLFNTGTEPVIAGELARFDSSLVTNDPYAIIVAAFDVNGRGFIQPTMVYVEGNVIVGNFRLEFTDLAIPLAGIPIQVNRIYDTMQADDEGDFGFGWTLGIQDARIFEAAAVGAGGALNGGNDKFIPGKTKVYLTNPEGQRVGFTYREQLLSGSFFGAIWRPYFEADPGVYDTLTIDETQVARGGIIGALAQGINPSHYTLTTKAGLKYRYHDKGGLQTITDLNGNVATFTREGIAHSSGQSIDFVRDHRGRIKEIVDPDGQKLLYEYNAKGDLVKFTNQAGLETTYTYLDNPAHYLDEAYDSLGRRVLKAQYDADNQFVGVVDALGNQVDSRDFDTANNTGVIRDGNNNATTLIYDDRGNVLEEIDPLGHKTIREYSDPNNPDLETRIIDRRGMVTERSYDLRGNLLTIAEKGTNDQPLDPPVVTSFTYNSRNDVTSIANAGGATTSFVYDSKSNLTQITNALGNQSKFTYDNKGQRTSLTDFNGNTTTFEYEAACPCGSPSKVTHADGTYQTFVYNQFGQVTLDQTFEADGTLVERMQTFYDSTGRVTREVMGGGNDPKHPITDVRKFYDGHLLEWEIIVSPESLAANGTLLESPATPVAQRKSRITVYKYDERDNLITQIDAMGGIVQFRYDAQGNRVLLQDPVGNVTTWTYDTLNRVAEERDPFYWVDFVGAHSTLDIDPLLAAVVDENQQPSSASLATNQGAAHVRSFAYDTEGNQSKIIDRNNRRREFSYDHAGRLLTERWYTPHNGPLVEAITYMYDILGNMKAAQNATSEYTYEYDQLNRIKSVDNLDMNPDTPRVVLNYDYDAQGNLIETSDDAWVTVQSTYDSRNQLKTRKWFDAIVPIGGTKDVADALVDFTYTASGRQKQIRRFSDGSATTKVGSTDFTYDLSGRADELIHKNAVDALLSSYEYEYDFSGLLIGEVRDHSDNAYDDTITYNYDLTGQLVDAAFNNQDDEQYVYDLNGNRISSVNGTEVRIYTTGPANQLKSDGIYNFEYDGEGNQTRKTRISDGQVTENFWDHHNRLVKVEERSAEGIVLKIIDYHYDVLGRRITEKIDGIITLRAVHDGDHTWGDYSDSGSTETRYLYSDLIDQVISANRSHEVLFWYLGNSVGTVTGLQIDLFNVLQYRYSTFGMIHSSPMQEAWNRFAFTSREISAVSDQYLYRSRFLDSNTGRFNSLDRIGFNSNQANLFVYVANNPLTFVDPTGESSVGYGKLLSLVSRVVAPVTKVLGNCVKQVVLCAVIGIASTGNAGPLPKEVTRAAVKVCEVVAQRRNPKKLKCPSPTGIAGPK